MPPRKATGMNTAQRTSTIATTAPCTSRIASRSEEHTSELQSPCNLVCRLLLEKKNIKSKIGRIRAVLPPLHFQQCLIAIPRNLIHLLMHFIVLISNRADNVTHTNTHTSVHHV